MEAYQIWGSPYVSGVSVLYNGSSDGSGCWHVKVEDTSSTGRSGRRENGFRLHVFTRKHQAIAWLRAEGLRKQVTVGKKAPDFWPDWLVPA